MTVRKYLVLLAVVVCASTGDVLLARGMKDIGQIHIAQIQHALFALANPWVLIGILCLCGFFASYSTALSWADLTYVLPATSISYVLLALLSKYFLHEQISGKRWIGIVLITIGVGFVAVGPSQTDRSDSPAVSDQESTVNTGERA